jgi:hypothetical protein
MHKVLTYVEYRAVSDVFQYIDPHPLSTQRVCPPPAPWGGGGVHTRRAVRGWGSIFWKTPGIRLACNSLIPLRSNENGTVSFKPKLCINYLVGKLSFAFFNGHHHERSINLYLASPEHFLRRTNMRVELG